MHAALQHPPGSTLPAGAAPAWLHVVPKGPAPAVLHGRKLRKLHIQGLTLEGRTFRPSDWAERLAGAMSCFRPGGVHGGIGAYIGYSPLCVPHVVAGVKCVIVSEELREVEPMAWDFVMNFARDNSLKLIEPGMHSPVPPADTTQ